MLESNVQWNRSLPPTPTDALAYISEVKRQFNAEEYGHFMTIIKGYESGYINIQNTIQLVIPLFRGNDILIRGFNSYLPPGYQV